MGVYVNDMLVPADVPNGDKVVSSDWSHLMADTHAELMAAARALHLNPAWIQYPGTAKEHFDLTSGKRHQALNKGIAEPITWRQSGELYAAKVQQEIEKEARADRERLDYDAGVAYRDGDLDTARQILNEARVLHPTHAGLWASRLDQIEKVARKAPEGRPEPSPLPRPGVHRDGGQTTVGQLGRFPRAPEPDPPHPCPGCTTVTERDGKTITSGPKIEQHQDVCQGCQVEGSIQDRPMPAHPEARTDRSDPAKACGKCGTPGVGPGGIICPPCREEIEARRSARELTVTPQPERDAVEAGQ